MKKLFALLLAVVMMMSLVACGGDKTPTEPTDKPSESQPTETPDNSTPSEPDDETTAPEGEWVIKEDVAKPQFYTPQWVRQQLKLLDGSTVEVGLYQTAWSKVDPQEIKTKVAPLVEEWTWSIETSETAYAEEYTDAGWQRSYDYTVRLIADAPEVDYVNDTITITFTGNTEEFDGWRGISVNYSTPAKEMSAEQQEFILKVLEVVYGKDIAEYMAYAPVTEQRYNEMSLSESNTIGSEKYGRKLDDRSVYFSMYAYNNKESGVDKYAGTYTSIMPQNVPEYCDLVFPNVGKLDFTNVPTIGAAFVTKQLNNYGFTEPSSIDKLYTYETVEYENGDRDISFHADLNVRQKDTTWIETMTFELEYDVEVRGDAVNVVRASIEMPAFAEDWDNNDPEDPAVIKRLSENLEKAKKAANAVFGTNFEFDAVHWNGSGDYKLNQNYEHELYGRKVQMSFEFMTKTMDSIGRNRASFKISIR